jgi:hypothetical protein
LTALRFGTDTEHGCTRKALRRSFGFGLMLTVSDTF